MRGGRQVLRRGAVVGGWLARAVEDKQHKLGGGGFLARELHADALGFAVRVAKSRRVGEQERHSAEGRALAKQVAGGARRGCDDGAALAEDGVEEGGFSRVRRADYRGADAFGVGARAVGAVERGFKQMFHVEQCVECAGDGQRLDVVVGVVDFGCEVRAEVDYGVVGGFQHPTERAGEHGGGVFGSLAGLGGYQLTDRLRFGKVELAV